MAFATSPLLNSTSPALKFFLVMNGFSHSMSRSPCEAIFTRFTSCWIWYSRKQLIGSSTAYMKNVGRAFAISP